MVFITAEIGINHNGDLDICKKLIDLAKNSGCDAVKFQKRTIDKVYSKEILDSKRDSPWGTSTREQKIGLEFEKEEYDTINSYCNEKEIDWYASAWDLDSQYFLQQYELKYNKIASAMLTNYELLNLVSEEKKHTFISTGMSTIEEISEAVKIFKNAGCPFELQHSNSSYPMKIEEANLKCIQTLRKEFNCDVGYSGHEAIGYLICVSAAVLGATSIERHITLDRTMWGSDQMASVEPTGLIKLVKGIRDIEKALGGNHPRVLLGSELKKQKTLRK